jgi:hypothetical protein
MGEEHSVTNVEFREALALVTIIEQDGPEGCERILESSDVPQNRLVVSLAGICLALAQESAKLMGAPTEEVLKAIGRALIAEEAKGSEDDD